MSRMLSTWDEEKGKGDDPTMEEDVELDGLDNIGFEDTGRKMKCRLK
jgi:hypothetical protein